MRTNKVQRIPHELGHLSRLSVLNISDNYIQNLPFSITRLRKLSAIWISENQVSGSKDYDLEWILFFLVLNFLFTIIIANFLQNKPLVPFQSSIDPDTGQRVLTCILLPQIPREDSEGELTFLNPNVIVFM